MERKINIELEEKHYVVYDNTIQTSYIIIFNSCLLKDRFKFILDHDKKRVVSSMKKYQRELLGVESNDYENYIKLVVKLKKDSISVDQYRLQDYDIVQFKNGDIALYHEYGFIIHEDLLRRIRTKYANFTLHTAFNKPKYTGNNKIDDLVVAKVKHNKSSVIDMECILNIYENHNIDWDIIF